MLHPFNLVRGQMLDVLPPVSISLTPQTDTYSPEGNNVIEGKWSVGEDDNVGMSHMWGLSGARGVRIALPM